MLARLEAELGDAVARARRRRSATPVVRVAPRRVAPRGRGRQGRSSSCDYLSFISGDRLAAGADASGDEGSRRHVGAGAADRR